MLKRNVTVIELSRAEKGPIIDGHELHFINDMDQSQTFAFIGMRNTKLYIVEGTVPEGHPEPGLFQQSLGWLDENGNAHPLSDAVSSRIPAAPERPWRAGARPGTTAGRARRAAVVYVVFGLGRT
jgi:hypothetical protein